MKLVIKEMYLNIIKVVGHKQVANIILYGQKLKSFPIKSEQEKDIQLLIQHSLGIPSQSHKTRRINKGNTN
jgi:hypothetical protein